MKAVAEAAVIFLLVSGSAVMFLGALGLYRMPDLYNRMQASAKATSLGVAMILLAVGFWFPEAESRMRAVAGILFVFLTTPVAAHLLARAAHKTGVPSWSGTQFDEFREFADAHHVCDDTCGASPEVAAEDNVSAANGETTEGTA
jgi:multicomponent Na+:H+ antiporter subunit G